MSSVDVAIPCYHYRRYLRAPAQSALDQASLGRVLIVDNASAQALARRHR